MVKYIHRIIFLIILTSCVSKEKLYKNLYKKLEKFDNTEFSDNGIVFNHFYIEKGLYETKGNFNIVRKIDRNDFYVDIMYIHSNGKVIFSTEKEITKPNINMYKDFGGILLKEKGHMYIEKIMTTKMNLGEGVSAKYKIYIKDKEIYMQIENDRCIVYSLME